MPEKRKRERIIKATFMAVGTTRAGKRIVVGPKDVTRKGSVPKRKSA